MSHTHGLSAIPYAIIGPLATATGHLTRTNDELAERFDTKPEIILRKIGVETRPIAPREVTPLELAWQALEPLIDHPLFNPDDLSMIIVHTNSIVQACPSVACDLLGRIQDRYPHLNVPAFDMMAACPGWLYALKTAIDHLQYGQHRAQSVLVITTETLSQVTNLEDFASAISFGDAATAAIVYGPDAPAAFTAFPGAVRLDRPWISAHSDKDETMTCPIIGTGENITMKGSAVRQHTVPFMTKSLQQAAELSQLAISDLALVLAHQSNKRVLADLAAALEVDIEKVPSNIQHLGNTSSSTIPLLLADLRRQSALQPGTHIGFTAFGGGYTFGAAVGKVLA